MNLDWLIDIPPEYQTAASIGLAFAIFFAVGIPLFFRLGGVGKRLSNNEQTIEAVRAEAQKNLEAKEQDFAHKISETQQAFTEKAEIDKRDFEKRLHSIAEKFGNDLAGYKTQLGTQNDLLQQKDLALITAIAERDEWRLSASNLNARLDELEKQVTEQDKRIEEMQRKHKQAVDDLQNNLNKANKENRDNKDLIATYKEEISKLSTIIEILRLEKKSMLEMATAIGLKLKSLEADGDTPPIAEKEKTETQNPA